MDQWFVLEERVITPNVRKSNKLNFNSLIPELTVSNLEQTKIFYVDILNFKVEYEYVLTTFEGVHMRRFAVFCGFGNLNVDFRLKNPVRKSVPELAVSRHIWKENYSEESAFHLPRQD